MVELSIAQALFDGETPIARSADFLTEWENLAATMCAQFGPLPPEVICPEALFAKPFASKYVAVVQVAGPPAYSSLRFRFLILNKELFNLLSDPFAIAEKFPPNWDMRGSLPELDWPPEPLPKRTIAQLDHILKHGDGPFLLGASQTLVDGGKILLQRDAPDNKLLRDLWNLLPDSTRRNLWPATYAFSNALGFDAVVMPAVPERGLPGYLTEDQTRDYPESRYERDLQAAVESNDQRMLDRLLARRSSTETLWLAVIILVVGVSVIIISRLLVNLGVI